MEVINLTRKQFDSLKEYELPPDLFAAEAKLYIFTITDKWKTIYKLLKKFYITSGPSFENKLKTIKNLVDFKNIIKFSK